MPNTAVLEKSLPALARTCMPKQRGQLSSTQLSPVHPSPAQGQGESLLTAWGWVNSFHQEPLQHTRNEGQSSAEQSKVEHSLKGRMGLWTDPWGGCSGTTNSGFRQKLPTDLGLSLGFVPLVAFTETERTWAETINTAGYRGLFLPWQEQRGIVFPQPQDIRLPSSQGHCPPLQRQRARARDTLREGSRRWGCSSSFHAHPTGEITGLDHFPAKQSHATGATGEEKKKKKSS